MQWKLNTSNTGKLKEFQHLFAQHGHALLSTHIDLREIEAEPLLVIAHKASQLEENIIVDDTSLDVEGAAIGINVRWLLDHLPEYIGRKALSLVLLAFREKNEIFVFRGAVAGKIVQSSGSQGFGYDSVFQPNGSNQTLAEFKPDHFNARALAVEAFLSGNEFARLKAIYHWEGPWQLS